MPWKITPKGAVLKLGSTSNYLVVIGRGNELDDIAKTYLRSYNRAWKNTELLTYDDVLVRFRNVITRLKNALDITRE